MYRKALSLVAALLPATAPAATLEVLVRDQHGKPMRDAVVSLATPQRTPAAPRFAWPMVVEQKDIQFDPYVLLVPVGASVTFPNRDKVRHHVYSFSKAKKFELKLYGREQARAVTFDKPGAVALGCNIHDGMSAFVKVVDTPFAAKTDARGIAVLAGLPAGGGQLRVWHPGARAPGNELGQPIALPAGNGRLQRTVSIPVAGGPR